MTTIVAPVWENPSTTGAQSTNSNSTVVAVDKTLRNGTQAIVVQNHTEANVKNGLQYYMRLHNASVAVNGVLNLRFQTGAKPVIIKSREVSFNATNTVEYVAQEGGTYTGGTAVTVENENRINPVASTVLLSTGGTIGGTPVVFRRKRLFSAGSTSGGASKVGTDLLGRETVLKPNTLYTVTMTNVSGATAEIQLELSWFEGTPDLPIP